MQRMSRESATMYHADRDHEGKRKTRDGILIEISLSPASWSGNASPPKRWEARCSEASLPKGAPVTGRLKTPILPRGFSWLCQQSYP